MSVRTKSTIVLALAAVLIVLGPATYRTIHIASSADGLLLLAWFPDDDFSLNPWSKSCYLIRQDTAAAILRNFDWPYSRRGPVFLPHEPSPLIHQAISSRGLSGPIGGEPYSAEADRRLMTLLKHFVERRGFSIDEPWEGLAPIHSAILFADAEVVQYLVEQGADLQAVIHNPGRKNDGMNSFEFAQLLVAKQPQRYRAIETILVPARNE